MSVRGLFAVKQSENVDVTPARFTNTNTLLRSIVKSTTNYLMVV